MSILSEFKEFALRGNVIDLAVGVVIGGAFGKIVTSLVNDLIMPSVAYLIGSSDFKSLSAVLRPATFGADGKETAPAVLLNYGAFIQTIVDFTIIALVIFLAIKAINRLRRQEQPEAAAPAEPSDEVKLLTEIRDALNRKEPEVRPYLTGALLALATLTASAESGLDDKAIRNAEGLRDTAMRGSQAYAIVESLTTEVGPRMGGSEAYDRATVWAQAKFKALGYDKVWLQPVTFPVWQRRSESARVISPFPQRLVLTALGGSESTNGDLRAEVVEFADLNALKAVPDGALAGKIAFVNLKMMRAKDGSGYGPVSNVRRSGASEAARKGAAALLIRSVGTDSDRLPHTGMMKYDDGVAKIPAAALSVPDADLLANMLRRGKPVTVEMNIQAGFTGSKTEYNVIGEITGRGKAGEVVVIGGHLDSWDLGTGAIDDGAGVAITMAAGALIGDMKQAPQRTVRVVAFANEEQGLLGGKAYAEAMKAVMGNHQLGAESDFGAGRIYAMHSGVSAESRPVIQQIARVLEPLGITQAEGGGPGPDISPSVPYGLPWVELQQDGSDYFDYHHTANDTLDKINAKDLDQQVAAYAVLAYLAAETRVDIQPAPLKSEP